MNKFIDSIKFSSNVVKKAKNIELECKNRNFILESTNIKNKIEFFRIFLDALGFAVFYKLYNEPHIIEFIKKCFVFLSNIKIIDALVFIILMFINILSTIAITSIFMFSFSFIFYFYKTKQKEILLQKKSNQKGLD